MLFVMQIAKKKRKMARQDSSPGYGNMLSLLSYFVIAVFGFFHSVEGTHG